LKGKRVPAGGEFIFFILDRTPAPPKRKKVKKYRLYMPKKRVKDEGNG
jgi:hypothetical protein